MRITLSPLAFLSILAITPMAFSTTIEETKDVIVIVKSAEGRPILEYRAKPGGLPQGFAPEFLRGGYISAVYTPSGTLVSDDYPPDHKHHHGIWSPWTKTEFEGRHPDFWNMGSKTGTVFCVSVTFDALPSKTGETTINARHRMIDLTAPGGPKSALKERWDLTVHAPRKEAPAANIFDLTITQTTATDSPLTLPKYHYGGLGFRGHRDWHGKTGCRFLTSEGKTRENGNETRAKWTRVSGDVAAPDGKPAAAASLTILCHPENFRFPQPVRIHPSEPFFCFAPQQLGEFKIEPGKPYIARYRFIASDGEPDAKMIEGWWDEYAKADQKP